MLQSILATAVMIIVLPFRLSPWLGILDCQFPDGSFQEMPRQSTTVFQKFSECYPMDFLGHTGAMVSDYRIASLITLQWPNYIYLPVSSK
jgi:hypothetical protein